MACQTASCACRELCYLQTCLVCCLAVTRMDRMEDIGDMSDGFAPGVVDIGAFVQESFGCSAAERVELQRGFV